MGAYEDDQRRLQITEKTSSQWLLARLLSPNSLECTLWSVETAGVTPGQVQRFGDQAELCKNPPTNPFPNDMPLRLYKHTDKQTRGHTRSCCPYTNTWFLAMSTRSQARVRTSWSKAVAFVPERYRCRTWLKKKNNQTNKKSNNQTQPTDTSLTHTVSEVREGLQLASQQDYGD